MQSTVIVEGDGNVDLNPVIEDYKDALFACWPLTRYQPMERYWKMRSLITTHLPSAFSDWFYILRHQWIKHQVVVYLQQIIIYNVVFSIGTFFIVFRVILSPRGFVVIHIHIVKYSVAKCVRLAMVCWQLSNEQSSYVVKCDKDKPPSNAFISSVILPTIRWFWSSACIKMRLRMKMNFISCSTACRTCFYTAMQKFIMDDNMSVPFNADKAV